MTQDERDELMELAALCFVRPAGIDYEQSVDNLAQWIEARPQPPTEDELQRKRRNGVRSTRRFH